MLTILAIGGGVLLVTWLALKRRPATSDTASEAKRFVLRVGAPPGKSVRLGTSVEVGEPSSEPTLIADEVALHDDAEQVVIIPAGQVLHVRELEGAVREPLEAVTTAAGTGRRYSFEIAHGCKLWILDAPGWRGCLGTTDPSRRRLPPRAEGYEITTRPPPVPDPDAKGTLTVTMANLTMPLWMHGLEGPEDWLLGARATDKPTVAIATFTDPHQDTRSSTGDVGSVCFQLLDAVWLDTTARATAGLPMVISRARIFTPEPLGWDELASWRQQFTAGTSFIWGAARRELDHDGFDVRLRSGDAEVELAGPLPALRRQIVELLETRGAARAESTARAVCARITPLPVELDGAYAVVTDLVFLLLMSNPKNQALPAQDSATQRRIVDLAKDLAEAAPASAIALLTWIVAAIYAHDGGGLSLEQRSAVIAFVRARSGEDDPIHRLAPAIYYRLGETGEAAAACRAALAWCTARADAYRGTLDADVAAYRTWVEQVLAKT
jgi:hypothetical protein